MCIPIPSATDYRLLIYYLNMIFDKNLGLDVQVNFNPSFMISLFDNDAMCTHNKQITILFNICVKYVNPTNI